MEYNKLIAVTGMPGLFEMIASKNDGAIVRSLDDKTTKFVSSRVHNFSHLETIEVYTNDENVNLADVFQAMKADKTALPDKKDNAAVRKYFEKVFPEMDFERVFASDMKKMVRWYEILDQNKIEIKLTEETPDEEAATENAAQSGTAPDEPVAEKKKPAAKKKAQDDVAPEAAGKKEPAAPKKDSVSGKKAASREEEAAAKEMTPKAKDAGSGSKKETPEAKKAASAKAAAPKTKAAAPKAGKEETGEASKKKTTAKKKGAE